MGRVLLLTVILLISASGHAQTLNFTLANPQPNLMEVYSGTFASGDVDGDGDIDLFMTGITPQKQTKLYLNNGTGNFTEVANTPFPRSGSSQAILKDLDNDGDLDLFFSGNNLLSQNFTHIYRNNGSGIFTQVTNNALPAFIKGAAIADVDNDGDQDLVISTSTVADVFLNNGNAVFSAQGSSVFTPVSGVVQFIDMENDGDQDVIISGASSIKLYQNNGSGNFTLNTNSTFAALSGSDIDVADTDNDGDLDFLINGSGSGGQNLLYINNGSGIFTQIATTLQQTFGGQNAISDLDNDGDQDILIVGTQAGGLPNIFNIVYRNTGNNVFVQTQILGGEYIADCAVADFTGDGLKDIIIQGFVDNTNAYWNTSTTACTPPNAPTGTLAITNSTCSACVVGGGSIAIGTVSGTGGTLEYSTNGGASWSATLPTYNQTGPAQTILASVLAANECRSNATQVGVTVPGTCTTPNAPTGTLAITNSTCSACVVGGGSIAIGTVSGTGGTLEYSTNGGASWSTTLPPYNQTGPAQTILASVLATSGCRSNATQVGVTVPGQCPAPDAPTGTLNIVNSTCSACIVGGGSITIGTVSGTGGTLEYSTNGGVNWSATLPTYNQTGPTQTILASVVDINGCRSTTTQVGVMVPGTCTTPNAPTGTLAIINSTCSNCVVGGGSISIGTVSGTGGTLEFSTNGGASWSATLPTYNQTGPAQTILASVLATSGCRSNATQVGVTVPGTCTTPNAPTGTLAITNSTCSNCVVGGGSISIGTVSGTGGTLEYSTNGGASWSATLPTYNQTGPAQTIIASVLAANGCRSNATQVGVTIPGTCTTPDAPTGTLAITNSTCNACVISGGSIAIGTVSGTGGTLEFSTNGGASWSATLPTYNQTGPAQTIIASVLAANGCRSNATQVGVTIPGTCTTPDAPTGTLAINNSTCNACVISGGSIAIGTVNGTGGTLEYSTNGGASWSATLPTYNQTGPAQTIIASVLATNGCRSNTTQVGVTVPGTCTIPTPTGILAITNSTCSACVVGGGSIAIGTVSGTGGTLEYSTDGGANWSTSLPTYNQTGPAQTIIASVLAANGCRSNAVQVGVTAPGTCTTPNAPTGTLAITNSNCSNCVVGGGSIALGTLSGTGGTLQYSTDGGTTWNAALPTYNQSGPAQTILASVLGANGCRSNTTQVGQTMPGTCTTPSAPTGTLAIVNSTCSNCTLSGGSIALGTVSGTGGTLQYSTDGGTTWNAALPTYNQSGPAQTILASVLSANGCRSNTTLVGQTIPGTCTTASAPTGTLAIVNSTCTNCVLSGGSIAIGTVSGTGGTLQYSTNGGMTWSAALPMYSQAGPAQTILASVLDANGCRSGSTTVGTTSPGNCGNQVLTTYYVDGDGDNYGTGPGQLFCTNPGTGFSLQAGDCNDNVPGINPGATEVCDGIDNNCNGTIDDVDGNTSGNWSSSDVGQAGGSSNFPPCGSDEDDIFNLSATGFSTSSSDKLHTVYQALCGNGEIIARVLNVSGGGWAGITLRETLMPGSKKVGLKTQLTNNIRREIRTTTNGATNMLNFLRPTHTWLRLVRTGSNVVGYTSTNGTTWNFAFSSAVSMTGCIYAGLFAESINASVTTTAAFDNVSVNGVVPALGANIQHTSITPDVLNVSVYPNPTSGEMTLSVAGAPERNLQLEVTDALGRTVRSVELPEDAVFTYPLDLSNEPAGVYYLRLRSESGMVSVQRIVVQQ